MADHTPPAQALCAVLVPRSCCLHLSFDRLHRRILAALSPGDENRWSSAPACAGGREDSPWRNGGRGRAGRTQMGNELFVGVSWPGRDAL